MLETGDEELKRISKGKEPRIRPGVMTHTDDQPDAGFHQRTKIIDADGNVSDASTRVDDLVHQSKLREKQEDEKKWKPIADFRSRWGGILAQQHRIEWYQTKLQRDLQALLEEEKKNPALKEHSKEFKRELGLAVIE
jgi:hypothetical protein